jgi:hypothetical protein
MTDKTTKNPAPQPGVGPGEEHREVAQPDSGQQGAQVDTTGDAQAPAPQPGTGTQKGTPNQGK